MGRPAEVGRGLGADLQRPLGRHSPFGKKAMPPFWKHCSSDQSSWQPALRNWQQPRKLGVGVGVGVATGVPLCIGVGVAVGVPVGADIAVGVGVRVAVGVGVGVGAFPTHYLPPVFRSPLRPNPPQTIISPMMGAQIAV